MQKNVHLHMILIRKTGVTMLLWLFLSCNRYEFFNVAGYEQATFSNDADILFVIDNSCSMWQEASALGTNFNVFIIDSLGILPITPDPAFSAPQGTVSTPSFLLTCFVKGPRNASLTNTHLSWLAWRKLSQSQLLQHPPNLPEAHCLRVFHPTCNPSLP